MQKELEPYRDIKSDGITCIDTNQSYEYTYQANDGSEPYVFRLYLGCNFEFNAQTKPTVELNVFSHSLFKKCVPINCRNNMYGMEQSNEFLKVLYEDRFEKLGWSFNGIYMSMDISHEIHENLYSYDFVNGKTFIQFFIPRVITLYESVKELVKDCISEEKDNGND